MNKVLMMVIAGFVALGISGGSVFGAIEQNSIEGVVVSISDLGLTVSDSRAILFTKTEEIQVNDATEFEVVSSLQDLKEGDQVEVEYYEEDGHKIAVFVLKKEAVTQESDS